MINIIITLDYEIFGNGAGDVNNHMIKPTERIIKVCNKHGVPLVIMFEVVEYSKFYEYDDVLCADLGYSPARLIKKQIISAFKNGHDVQLHIHHQWSNSKYENGKWIINDWKIPIEELPQEDINELIKEGKCKLENLLKYIHPSYRCVAIRLTNLPWSEAPELVHQPMIKNEIKLHSLSVSNNIKNNKKGYWALDPYGRIFEFPIHSQCVPFYKIFSINRIINELKRFRYTIFRKQSGQNRSKVSKNRNNSIFRLMKNGYNFKWDLCRLSAKKMIEFLEIGMSKYDSRNYEVPLIMIGHSKDFFSLYEFDKFIKITKEKFIPRGLARFSTFKDFVEKNL